MVRRSRTPWDTPTRSASANDDTPSKRLERLAADVSRLAKDLANTAAALRDEERARELRGAGPARRG